MDTLTFGLVLLAELVPLFLVISFAVHLTLESITPERISQWMGAGSVGTRVAIALGLGSVTPFCSCSTVPLVNGMRRAGVPTAPLVTFLLASPLVSPIAFGLLWSAFGVGYATAYVGAAWLMAVGSALVLARVHGTHVDGEPQVDDHADTGCGSDACSPSAEETPVANGQLLTVQPRVSTRLPFRARGVSAFAKSVSDLRELWVPLLAAVAIGAAVHGYVPEDLLASLAGPGALLAVPVAAIAGIPVYASVVVLLPIATTLIAKGVGIGAVTAFLLAATGLSIPEGMLLSRILPRSLLWRVIVAFSVSVIIIGYTFQLVAAA